MSIPVDTELWHTQFYQLYEKPPPTKYVIWDYEDLRIADRKTAASPLRIDLLNRSVEPPDTALSS